MNKKPDSLAKLSLRLNTLRMSIAASQNEGLAQDFLRVIEALSELTGVELEQSDDTATTLEKFLIDISHVEKLIEKQQTCKECESCKPDQPKSEKSKGVDAFAKKVGSFFEEGISLIASDLVDLTDVGRKALFEKIAKRLDREVPQNLEDEIELIRELTERIDSDADKHLKALHKRIITLDETFKKYVDPKVKTKDQEETEKNN